MLAQQISNGLMLGSVYALVAVAFSFTIGILKFLNFSLPAVFMLAAMLTWQILDRTGSLASALAGVIAASIAMSLVIERFTYSRMGRGSHLIPLVSSLAFLILFENLALITWGSDLKRVSPPYSGGTISAGPVIAGIPQVISLLVSIAAVAALQFVLAHTMLGRWIRTIAEDPEVATILGISVSRVVPLIFCIGGVFSAIAGLLFALNYQQVGPYVGDEVALKGISAMVIGGLGNIWGAIIGGLLIGVLEAFSIHWLGARAVDACVYGVLLMLLFVRPAGLFGAGNSTVKRA